MSTIKALEEARDALEQWKSEYRLSLGSTDKALELIQCALADPTTPSAEALAAEIKSLADEYAEASAADARHYAPGRKAAARVNLYVEIDRLASSGQAASAVPEGMRLVPIEPTVEMVDAASAKLPRRDPTRPEIRDAYAAMLEAAPTQPASAPAREGEDG